MSSLLEISNKMAFIFSVDGAVWSKSRYFSYSVHGASDINSEIRSLHTPPGGHASGLRFKHIYSNCVRLARQQRLEQNLARSLYPHLGSYLQLKALEMKHSGGKNMTY